MVAGDIPSYQKPVKAAHLPVLLHLALVLIIGIFMPDFLNTWFHTAVELLK
jgi:hydrogenase-4 component F